MTDSDSIKVCTKCHRQLTLNDFYKLATGRGGLRPDCRECCSKRRRKGYLANQEARCAYSRQYYQDNKEKATAAINRYVARNRYRTTERQKKWRAANKEKLKADKQRDWILNRERYRLKRQIWVVQHPEYNKVSTHKRRARLRAAQGFFSSALWIAKCEYHGWRCYLCGIVLTKATAHADHRKPISRGGLNWISNIAPACAPCNLSKSRKTEQEYRRLVSR